MRVVRASGLGSQGESRGGTYARRHSPDDEVELATVDEQDHAHRFHRLYLQGRLYLQIHSYNCHAIVSCTHVCIECTHMRV
jgi:hypothetical protein